MLFSAVLRESACATELKKCKLMLKTSFLHNDLIVLEQKAMKRNKVL